MARIRNYEIQLLTVKVYDCMNPCMYRVQCIELLVSKGFVISLDFFQLCII